MPGLTPPLQQDPTAGVDPFAGLQGQAPAAPQGPVDPFAGLKGADAGDWTGGGGVIPRKQGAMTNMLGGFVDHAAKFGSRAMSIPEWLSAQIFAPEEANPPPRNLSSLIVEPKGPQTLQDKVKAERDAKISAFVNENFDSDTPAFKGGGLLHDVALTSGVPGAIAGPLRSMAPASGPLSTVIPRLATAIESGGFNVGAKALPAGSGLLANAANVAGNTALRATGGAVAGGATAGLLDPDSAGMGAVIGGALPLAARTISGGAQVAGKVAGAAKDAFFPNVERAAGDVLRSYAGNPTPVLRQAATPGVDFTLGQASGDAGLLALENAQRMRNNVPFMQRSNSNNAALGGALDRMAPSVPAADDALRQAVVTRLQSAKGNASKLYDAVSLFAQSAQPAVPANTRSAAQRLLGEYPDLFQNLADTPLKSKLQALVAETTPKTPPASPIILPPGYPAPKPQPVTATWEDLNWLRQRIGNYLGRARQQAGAVGSEETRALSQVLEGVTNDQVHLAAQSGMPELVDALNLANTYYKARVVPFKSGPLKNAVSDPMANAGALLVRPGSPQQGQLAGALLNAQPGSKPAVQAAYLARLADAARTGSVDQAGNRVLSPASLTNFVDSSQPLFGLLSSPQKQQVGGLLGDLRTLGSGTALRVKGGSDTAGQIAGIDDLAGRVAKGLFWNNALGHVPLLKSITSGIAEANRERALQMVNAGLLDPKLGVRLMRPALPPMKSAFGFVPNQAYGLLTSSGSAAAAQ